MRTALDIAGEFCGAGNFLVSVTIDVDRSIFFEFAIITMPPIWPKLPSGSLEIRLASYPYLVGALDRAANCRPCDALQRAKRVVWLDIMGYKNIWLGIRHIGGRLVYFPW